MLFKSSVLLALLSAVAALRIDSPASLTVCQPVSITFAEGTAPYYLSVLPGGEPSATPLKQFGQQQSSPYTWTVDIPAGTSITLSVKDSTGQVAYSSQTTVQAGSSTDCLNGSGAASGSASASATSGAASAASATKSEAAASKTSGAASAGSAAASASGAAGLTKDTQNAALLGLAGLAAVFAF